MPRRPTLIPAPALIYFAHPLDSALIQGNTVSDFLDEQWDVNSHLSQILVRLRHDHDDNFGNLLKFTRFLPTLITYYVCYTRSIFINSMQGYLSTCMLVETMFLFNTLGTPEFDQLSRTPQNRPTHPLESSYAPPGGARKLAT